MGWGWALIWVWLGGRGGGCLFEAGRLLTFSAFRMGAYSRWALMRGWALIRINTVTLPDPDLEMRGGGSSRPLDKIVARSPKKMFSVWSKNKGGPGPPGPLPYVRHWIQLFISNFSIFQVLVEHICLHANVLTVSWSIQVFHDKSSVYGTHRSR